MNEPSNRCFSDNNKIRSHNHWSRDICFKIQQGKVNYIVNVSWQSNIGRRMVKKSNCIFTRWIDFAVRGGQIIEGLQSLFLAAV